MKTKHNIQSSLRGVPPVIRYDDRCVFKTENNTFEDEEGDIKNMGVSGCRFYLLPVSPHRVLGGAGDEQRHRWISPAVVHGRRGPGLATPPSGGRRGGHGGGAGTRPLLVLHPQRRHGEDPTGRPARVEPQQLLLRQVGS